MAITFLEERKIQKRFILVLAIILLIIAFVIWKGFFEEKPISPGEIVKPTKKIEIDFEILESPVVEGLQSFEEIGPIEADTKIGRENPFMPYLPESE